MAMRLSPHLHGAHIGPAYLLLRRYDDAIAALRESIVRTPDLPINYMYLAAVYNEIGQSENARAQVDRLLDLIPGYSIEFRRQRWPSYRNPADDARLDDGLRKAGVPE